MIPLMKAAFLDEQDTKEKLATFILTTSKLSMGDQCLKFETDFAKWQNRKYAILCNSGGSANLLLLQSLLNLSRIKHGESIGFSALTWATNVMPIMQLGLKSVPLDCDLKYLNVTTDILKESVDKIKVLFTTNVLGLAGDMVQISQLCKDHNIILIEDNCEALGTSVDNIKCGNFGLASTFSFYVAHHMSTIEGGMVCTDDDELAQMLIMTRANGWDRNLTSGQQKEIREKYSITSEFKSKYTFYDLAFNVRPTEITGFLGSVQLEKVDAANKIRNKLFLTLEATVKTNKDLCTINHEHLTIFAPFAFPVICKNKTLRDIYLQKFMTAGVEVRPLIAGNITNQPFYKKYDLLENNLPNTDILDECGFYFGVYPELTPEDIKLLTELLRGTNG